MTQACTLFYNPNCSTCRKAKAMLEEQGITPQLVKYLDEPPTEQILRDVLQKLGIRPIALVRTKEAIYSQLGLEAKKDDDQAIIAAMVQHPILIQRPIVIMGNKAIIGRPAQKVLDIATQ